MTKQERIREGIDMKSPIPQALNRVFLELLRDYEAYKLGQEGEVLDTYIAKAITNAIYELHSQGVVKKVEKELPDCLMAGQISYDRQTYKDMLIKAGFVAVEPLIEEG